MLWLCGVVHTSVSTHPCLGLLLTPTMGNRPSLPRFGLWWAADTGCYRQGARFDLAQYLTWLERLTPQRFDCLFATAPDVVGDATATLARSLPVLPQIRAQGFDAALVAQDGLEALEVPWSAFDVLFIGGSTGWKLSAAATDLIAEAQRRRRWVHMGRVNSLKRLRAAAQMGCESADGTFLAAAPDRNSRRVQAWLAALEACPSLWQPDRSWVERETEPPEWYEMAQQDPDDPASDDPDTGDPLLLEYLIDSRTMAYRPWKVWPR